MRSARLAKVQLAGVARNEQVWLVRLGSAPWRGCIETGKVRDQQAWPMVSCVLVLAVLSREEHCSEVQRLLHVVQVCSPCATCAVTDRRPLPSRSKNTGLEAGKCSTCWRSAERTSLVVEAWVGSSAELRSNWQRAGPANLASCRGDSIPVCMPWGIAPSWSEVPKRRCRGGTEARAGCSRSDAVRCGTRGWQKYSMLA